MRNALAQWVLSLVTREDRAAAILGDLLDSQLGPMSFWSSLLQIAIFIGLHRPYRLLLNLFLFSLSSAGLVLFIWVYTHVIGVSCLLTALILIPMEVLHAWVRNRRHRSPQTRAQRSA